MHSAPTLERAQTEPDDLLNITLEVTRGEAVFVRRALLAAARTFDAEGRRGQPRRLGLSGRFRRMADTVLAAYHDGAR